MNAEFRKMAVAKSEAVKAAQRGRLIRGPWTIDFQEMGSDIHAEMVNVRPEMRWSATVSPTFCLRDYWGDRTLYAANQVELMRAVEEYLSSPKAEMLLSKASNYYGKSA